MFRSLNKKGFSLVNMLVALAVGSVVMLTVPSLAVQMIRMSKYSEFIEHSTTSFKLIEIAMMDDTTCTDNLRNIRLDLNNTTPINQILSTDSTGGVSILFVPGNVEGRMSHKEANLVSLYEIYPNHYLIHLDLTYEQTSRSVFGAGEIVRSVALEARTDNNQVIQECTASGLNDTSGVLAGQSCPTGEYINGFDANGAPQCEAISTPPTTPSGGCRGLREGEECFASSVTTSRSCPRQDCTSMTGVLYPYTCDLDISDRYQCVGGQLVKSPGDKTRCYGADQIFAPSRVHNCPFQPSL